MKGRRLSFLTELNGVWSGEPFFRIAAEPLVHARISTARMSPAIGRANGTPLSTIETQNSPTATNEPT